MAQSLNQFKFERDYPMKTKMFTTLLTAAISLTAFAGQNEGGAGPGGGNGDTDNSYDLVQRQQDSINYTRSLFGDHGEKINSNLVTFIQSLSKFNTSNSKIATKLLDLADKGLVEEISNAKYEFMPKCLEQVMDSSSRMVLGKNGQPTTAEKDASTLRGIRGAPICINLNRLVLKNLSESQILGLAMHENVRHFLTQFENDTETLIVPTTGEKVEFHPIAVFTTKHAQVLSLGVVHQWPDLLAEVKDSIPLDKDLTIARPRYDQLVLFSSDPYKYAIVVKELSKNCPKYLSSGRAGDQKIETGSILSIYDFSHSYLQHFHEYSCEMKFNIINTSTGREYNVPETELSTPQPRFGETNGVVLNKLIFQRSYLTPGNNKEPLALEMKRVSIDLKDY